MEQDVLYHCEDDGLVVKVGPGPQLMFSRDCGATWSPLTRQLVGDQPSPAPRAFCRAQTPDGQRVVVGENPGSIWISLDGGLTWQKKTVGPDSHRRQWVAVAISADEQRLAAVVRLTREALAVVYVSENWGESWYRAKEFSIAAEPERHAS